MAKTKALIVHQLKHKLPLRLLLRMIGLSVSSYYYTVAVLHRVDAYAEIRKVLHEIAEQSWYTYGSAGMWIVLRRRGIIL